MYNALPATLAEIFVQVNATGSTPVASTPSSVYTIPLINQLHLGVVEADIRVEVGVRVDVDVCVDVGVHVVGRKDVVVVNSDLIGVDVGVHVRTARWYDNFCLCGRCLRYYYHFLLNGCWLSYHYLLDNCLLHAYHRA